MLIWIVNSNATDCENRLIKMRTLIHLFELISLSVFYSKFSLFSVVIWTVATEESRVTIQK